MPRLFNRIYGKMQDKIKEATGVKGWLVNKAIAAKLDYLKSGTHYTHKLYDAIVFSKMKAMLGGQVRIMITGSAPIAADTLNFLKIAFCCPINEAYGMTETCGASVMTFISDPNAGHVGGPVRNAKLMLRDIPEMNYLHTNELP